MSTPKPTVYIKNPIAAKRPSGWEPINPTQFPVQSFNLSWSWGAEPAQCNLVYISSIPASLGSAISLEVGQYYFSGVCTADVELKASGGRHRQLTFYDYRRWLSWDKAYCLFNQIDDRVINGARARRFRHILPWNFGTYSSTWTNSPYTAAQIIQLILNGPGIETPWRVGYLNSSGVLVDNLYHPNLGTYVYNVDCLQGKSVATALSEICAECGLLFTHYPSTDNLFRIAFAQKGVDGPAVTPPANSDQRQVGTELTGYPTRVRVLGDRNLYQIHDIVLQPDWNRNWDQFYDLSLVVKWLIQNGKVTWNKTTDPEQIVAFQEALALANELTVSQLATLTGINLTDTRRHAGRSRNDMPVPLYIRNILFRCFSLPSGFWFRNTYGSSIGTSSVELLDKLLARVTHDATTGLTSYDSADHPDSNAYVIVRGYQIGHDAFETIRPERFNVSEWLSTQNVWQKIDVRIEDGADPSGMAIVFDEPVIKSEDLVQIVDGYATFKANPTFTVPDVRATLTFAAEKFSWFQNTTSPSEVEDAVIGLQIHDEVLNIGGLNGEFVSRPGASLVELPYADGYYCRQIAIAYANNLLKRQWSSSKGPFTAPLDDTITYRLHGQIDRVSLQYGPSGKTVTVELTNERDRPNYIRERDLDRMRSLVTLFPGQAEVRRDADAARKIATVTRRDKDAYRLLSDSFNGNFTEQRNAILTFVEPSVVGTVAVGEVFVKPPNLQSGTSLTQTGAQIQSYSAAGSNVFAGVSVRGSESVHEEFGAHIRLQSTGIALVRVRGPVSAGDALVTAPAVARLYPDALSCLVKAGSDDVAGDSDSTGVGIAMQAVAADQVKLIRVNLGAGSGCGENVEVTLCDQDTGDTAQYLICGSEVTS